MRMVEKVHVLHVPGADPERDALVAAWNDRAIEVCLHLDPERTGIMPNWLSAVTCAVDDGTKWSLIVQDDADPLPGWRDHLTEALLYAPEPFVSLSYFGAATESAVRRGVPFIVGPHFIWGAAVAYHHALLPSLAEWARFIYDETGYQHDDRLISAFAQKSGHGTAVTTRALFDQPVQKSLVGHAGSSRRPSVTIATQGPAQTLRWGSTPRSVRRTSSGAKDQRDWLASYGTPDQPTDHTFVKMRSGAVKKVAL